MTITRRSLAETYAEHDAIIEAAQAAKRDATQAYRAQLDDAGMDRDAIKAEIEGFKLAYRRKVAIEKKGEETVEHRDAIADEIFAEIATPRAPRATHASASGVPADIPHDAETGEITEPSPAAKIAAGLTEALAIVKGEAEPHRVHQIPGNGAGTAEAEDEVALYAAASAETNSPAVSTSGWESSSAGTEGEADRQPISEPADRLAADAGSDGSTAAMAPVATNTNEALKKRWTFNDPAHRDCLNPGMCGGFSNLKLCQRCREASEMGQVA